MSKAAFNKGDRVEYTGEDSMIRNTRLIGAKGTIVRPDGSGAVVDWDDKTLPQYGVLGANLKRIEDVITIKRSELPRVQVNPDGSLTVNGSIYGMEIPPAGRREFALRQLAIAEFLEEKAKREAEEKYQASHAQWEEIAGLYLGHGYVKATPNERSLIRVLAMERQKNGD